MAKKDLQDSRVEFIEAVSRTENFKILRSLVSTISGKLLTFNMKKSDLDDLENQAVDKIKALLGELSSEFYPLQEIDRTSTSTYFEKLSKGFNHLNEEEIYHFNMVKKKNKLLDDISKKKRAGKLDKVKELELKLEILERPEEWKEKIEGNILQLNQRYNDNLIDADSYSKFYDMYEKYLKECKKLIRDKKREKEKEENVDYYKNCQTNIRNFIGKYFLGNINTDCNDFFSLLSNYEGAMQVDFEHILLLYNYLRNKNYAKIRYIEGLLYYFAIERFVIDVSPFFSYQNKLILKDNTTEIVSEKHPGYERGYIPYYLLPRGYKGYIFEPKNLAIQSFMAAIDKKSLSIDTMVDGYKLARQQIEKRKKGILFSFLDIETENKLLPKLLNGDFNLDYMDGEYRSLFLKEYKERRNVFGGMESFKTMTDMYNRVVKPYSVEVLGSYIRNYFVNLAYLKDKDAIKIYYISAQRVGIAVRDDISDKMLSDIFDKSFLSVLKKVETITLEDIVFAKYF